MMHKPSVGSFTLVGQISIVLLLVVPLTIQATQFANRIHNDVIEDHIFEGLDDLDYIPQWLPTSSNHLGSDPLGSASNHWSSGFPWGTMNDIPPLGAQKPPRPEATNLKEKTISSDLPTPIPNTPPVDHHEGAVDGREHRLAQILNSDFERADILKAAEPHHTHVHSGLDDSFYWEHQPSPAEPGPSFSTFQASESLRHDQDVVIRQNMQENSRRLVNSEILAPPEPRDGNFPASRNYQILIEKPSEGK